jgi:hypothetical protein
MKISKSESEFLLKNETFIKVCDKIRQEQVKVFLGSTLDDSDAREESYRTVRLLDKFERILKNAIVDEERKDKRK